MVTIIITDNEFCLFCINKQNEHASTAGTVDFIISISIMFKIEKDS